MKRILAVIAAAAIVCPAFAAGAEDAPAPEKTPEKETRVKEELKNHFSLYGFIRNYFAFDSRESASGTGNLFYYLPFDRELDSNGEDLNATPSFRFLSITSRVGLDVKGYRVGNMDISAKVETDFYAGLSGSTGTATLRLRQAYMKLGWKDLPMCGDHKASVSLLMGQAWHPMAADQPDVISLATGAPFNPFNRSPQVTMDAGLGKHFTLTAALIYQMQYTSVGPEGASANYMKYGILPEAYLGLTYKTEGFLARAGASLLSIKPYREYSEFAGGSENIYKASGRMTAVSPYFYLQYKYKSFTLKAKTVYGSAADFLNQVSGYGVTGIDGSHYSYAATHTSSSWISLSIGKKVQGMLMAGYINNLGASEDMTQYWFFSKDGGNFKNLSQAYRIVPTVVWNIGKFTLGLEYEMTSAQYGDHVLANGKVAKNGEVLSNGGDIATRHWVTNHRVQLMTKFNF